MIKRLILLLAIIAFTETNAFSDGPKQTYLLTFESVYPKGHMRLKFVEDCLDQIETRSNGKIKFFRNYGKPARKDKGIDALVAGNIDILVAYPTYYTDKIAIGSFQQLPGNFKGWEDCWDLLVNGKVGEIVDQVYMKHANVKYLGAFPIGPYNFQITKKAKKVRTLEDFKGLKIRGTSVESSSGIKALGAQPVDTIGDYYKALEKGSIDGGLMTSYTIKQYNLWEVCDEVVEPPFIGYVAGFFWMSANKWNKMDDEARSIIIDVIHSKELWAKWVKVYTEKQDEPIIAEAKARGMDFFVLPPEEVSKMYTLTSGCWDSYVTTCQKQGIGEEALEIKNIIRERFNK